MRDKERRFWAPILHKGAESVFYFIGKFYDLPYEIKTLRGLCTDA